jgi:hypothetical protein
MNTIYDKENFLKGGGMFHLKKYNFKNLTTELSFTVDAHYTGWNKVSIKERKSRVLWNCAALYFYCVELY